MSSRNGGDAEVVVITGDRRNWLRNNSGVRAPWCPHWTFCVQEAE